MYNIATLVDAYVYASRMAPAHPSSRDYEFNLLDAWHVFTNTPLVRVLKPRTIHSSFRIKQQEMDQRSHESPMDFEWANRTGPINSQSPFLTASRQLQEKGTKSKACVFASV